MTDRIKLAEELEAAQGPSRELDQKIARAVGWTHFFVQKDMWWRPPAHLNRSATSDPPRFSASIDAAMTLGDEDEMAQHMREAFSMVQMLGWPEGDFTGQLARFIASAALKAGE